MHIEISYHQALQLFIYRSSITDGLDLSRLTLYWHFP